MKNLFVLLCLFPFLTRAQPDVTKSKNGTYSIDFSKKKKISKDSTIQSTTDDDVDDDGNAVKVKGKKYTVQKAHPIHRPDTYDFRKDGIFKGLFTAGLNACQIDGDNQWGYKYLGAEAGIGAMARFHRYFSVSLELDYTMKGAKDRLQSSAAALQDYQVQWDYVSAPIAVNGHFFKDQLTVSAGFAPGAMVRYKELNQDGINVTGHSPYGQPHRFDLDAFAGIQYTLKKHYGFGFKYSYSTISIRNAVAGRENGWINGQFNNDLTFRFVYILGPFKKK
jgi:hypothetical protein